jgi:Fic family protein
MKNAGESISQWGHGVNGELMDTPLSRWARREARTFFGSWRWATAVTRTSHLSTGARHRSIYYDLLDRVRREGDWEAWIDFFLEGVEQKATAAVQTVQRVTQLFAEDIDRLQTQSGVSAAAIKSQQRVLAALRERPLCNLKVLADRCGLSFPTTAKTVQALVSRGLVHELTGQRRNRVFAYTGYLHILNEEET